jgi:hypothetical protein
MVLGSVGTSSSEIPGVSLCSLVDSEDSEGSGHLVDSEDSEESSGYTARTRAEARGDKPITCMPTEGWSIFPIYISVGDSSTTRAR